MGFQEPNPMKTKLPVGGDTQKSAQKCSNSAYSIRMVVDEAKMVAQSFTLNCVVRQ